MIYILGSSHAISVLRACWPDATGFHNALAARKQNELCFSDYQPTEGVLAGKRLKYFLIAPELNFSAHVEPTKDKPLLVAAPGYLGLLESIKPVNGDDILFSLINGHEHSILSLAQHEVPYDFLLPTRPDIPMQKGHQVVSYDTVATQIELMLHQTIAMLTVLRLQLPAMHICCVLPPPPIASEAQIRSAPEIFSDQLARFGITPLSIRLKYYWACCDVLKAQLKRLNISFLEPPASALNPDGSLPDQYANGCSHANELYGGKVLAQIKHLSENG